ncbi:MAG: YkgJ family cysteine cluster protein [Sandaracinaceae bacterium]
MTRPIEQRYEDPLDRIWRTALARIGLRVTRSAEVFASTDGRGTLTLGEASTLDADDCLAQMVLHELCHALVEGPESLERPDWGLENDGPRDLFREHACLRLQAYLAGAHGLRRVLAPTTEHRAFYDRLGPMPLEPRSDATVQAARRGLARADRPPWGPHLRRALTATALVARMAAEGAEPGSLWALVEGPPPRHPGGPFLHAAPPAGARCGTCVWQRLAGPGPRVPRCHQLDDRRVDPVWPACEWFEGSLDCHRCGACCREAYTTVELGPRERLVRRHPELVEERDGRLSVRRSGRRCAALEGAGDPDAPFTCRVYEDRPRTCREFARGSASCLDARRRVGL